jgi:hypothetical protein
MCQQRDLREDDEYDKKIERDGCKAPDRASFINRYWHNYNKASERNKITTNACSENITLFRKTDSKFDLDQD